ncbi:hypothetical protein ACFOU2_09750 [Bacillus songklensis]|uniref:YhzD-like protein n=1 Tax=Bacillus songklensis TaxID=1069116 RepID=A0ABV8B0G0_9BACI
MYLVTFKAPLFGGFSVQKFETLDEAKDLVKELYRNGHHDVILSQEIPMKVTVNVEF